MFGHMNSQDCTDRPDGGIVSSSLAKTMLQSPKGRTAEYLPEILTPISVLGLKASRLEYPTEEGSMIYSSRLFKPRLHE